MSWLQDVPQCLRPRSAGFLTYFALA